MAGDSKSSADQTGFECLLSEITARFMNLQADAVDSAIEDTQRRVCEFLGLDLSALWQLDLTDPTILVMTHLYRPLITEDVPERMEASEYHPWSLEKVNNNEIVALSSTRNFPPGAERDAEVWHHYGIKTLLTFPLSMGGEAPFGAVSFNDMRREEREWTEPLVRRLKLVAELFAGAIARKRTEQELRDSAERLALVMNAADAGPWDMCLDTLQVWASDKTRELFQLDPLGDLTDTDFYERVHEADRSALIQTLEDAVEAKRPFKKEYRIVLSDGTIRWILSSGHIRCLEGGTACRLLGLSVDITERKQAELELKEALAETQELRDRLSNENTYLREQVFSASEQGNILGNSEPVFQMLEKVQRVAPTDSSVLITGETGTGKELLAHAIHDNSARKNRAMVKVNCAALPAALIESELFGREKGAYTGAMTQQTGRFEVADGSTIFLDEIGDLPIELQTKLLRVLQDGQFERLGSHKTLHADVRIIAATNRDLEQMISDGTFREDLYHRLNIFPIESPPLRDRRDDIPELTWRFVQEFNQKMGRSVDSIPTPAMEGLQQYGWPGNIRELRNLIERAMIMSSGKTLCIEIPNVKCPCKNLPTLEEVERSHILDVLEISQWRIGGPAGAAEALGMARTTLNSRMKKLGITRS
jgi:transcriptional regulator with GAF, ATPase, and Fis domain